jgi:hypothetical protein
MTDFMEIANRFSFYVKHLPNCDVFGVPLCMTDKECTCGLDKTMTEFLRAVRQYHKDMPSPEMPVLPGPAAS